MAKYIVNAVYFYDDQPMEADGLLDRPCLQKFEEREGKRVVVPFEVEQKDLQLFYKVRGETYSVPLSAVKRIWHHTPPRDVKPTS